MTTTAERAMPILTMHRKTRADQDFFWREPIKSALPLDDTLTIYTLTRIVGRRGIPFMGKPTDLVQGTLDLLILTTLSLEPKHGRAIAKRIQQVSKEVLQVQQGSLYPALYRLERQGWIKADWRE